LLAVLRAETKSKLAGYTCSSRASIHPRRLKPAAPADRGDHEVELRVHRVAAFLDEVFWRLFAGADLDQPLLLVGVAFAEMGAKPALSVVNLEHLFLLSGR
jgi:hypothetical protein